MAVIASEARTLSRTQGIVFVMVAGLLWSTIGIGVRAMQEASSYQLVFYRASSQVPFIVGLVIWRFRGRTMQAFRSIGGIGVLGAMCLAMAYVTGIFAIAHTTVANAVFLFSIAPLMTALLGWVLLNERVRRATWYAMGLALVGIVIMTESGGSGAAAGNFAAFLSAVGYAGFTVSLRANTDIDMLPMIALSGVFAMIMAFVLAGDVSVPLQDRLIGWGLGAGALGVGLAMFTAGSRVLTSAELPLVAMTEVVLAPLWVWILFDESITIRIAIGGTVVLVAVLMQAYFGIERLRLPRGYTS